MKNIFENVKWGAIFWITALVVMILWRSVYASVNNNWTNPNDLQATSWSPLTASWWNAILSNQNALSGAINDIQTQINTLPTSWLPSWVVVSGWKAFATDTTKRTWFDANKYCWNLTTISQTIWIWRIASLSELLSIYKNKSGLISLALQSGNYWSDTFYHGYAAYSGYDGNRVVNMSNGSTWYYGISDTYYVLCIYD